MKHFDQILAEAKRLLKKDGDLPLIAAGFDQRGRGFKIWMQVENDNDKERFGMAIFGNLLVHQAIEYFVFFTGWMVMLDKGEKDLQTRPSKDPRRKEVLIVYGESRTDKAAKLFIIDRDEGGRLLKLIEREDLNESVIKSSQMRFAGLLGDPQREHIETERESLREMLKQMPEIFKIFGPEPLINPALN